MKIKTNRFFHMLKEYLTVYLPDQKAASGHTIKSYRESLNLLVTYLADSKGEALYKVTFDDISSESIETFLTWLSSERKCGASTLNQRLSAIRASLKYAGMKNILMNDFYIESQKVAFRKQEKRLTVLHFSEKALEAILKQPNPSKKKQHRDLFFLVLLYDTGARDSEMLDLYPADIITKGSAPYAVIHGKGRKVRTVPIMEKTVQHFQSYIKRVGLDASDNLTPLFFTEIHGIKCHMSDDNVARFIDHYAAMARKECEEVPQNVTPHMWRHSRALHLYRKGVPLPLISEWLGHSNMETTLIYAYADTEMKRAAIEKAMDANHPLRKQECRTANGEDEDSFRHYFGLK